MLLEIFNHFESSGNPIMATDENYKPLGYVEYRGTQGTCYVYDNRYLIKPEKPGQFQEKGPRAQEENYTLDGASQQNLDATALQTLFARADAGVIPMFPDSCVGVPNKLADYAAAGLRVVYSLPGETTDIASRFAAGAFYAAGDVQSFKNAASALRHPAPDFKPDAFRDFFDARRLYAGYVDFIQKLMRQP